MENDFPKNNFLGFENFDANGNKPISSEEKEQMLLLVEEKFNDIFDILRISRNDPNSTKTPRRISKMLINELFSGRFEEVPKITVFPNRNNVNNLIISRGIKVMSVCSHHWQPISGLCSIGYIPNKSIIGLSKLSRIVDWFSRRGQIQEELGEQIADYLEQERD
jgi:GTP cyclohydrolase I